MNDRIRLLREKLGLSRVAFGQKLGVSGDVINNLERGRVEIKEPMIKLICREFGVNENWLRNGIEPIYISSTTFNLDEFVKSRGASDLELEIMKSYFDLDPDVRKKLMDHFKNLLAAPKHDLFDGVPDTPEELEKRFPPVDPDDKNVAG